MNRGPSAYQPIVLPLRQKQFKNKEILSLPGHDQQKMVKDTLIIIKYDEKGLGENEYCLYQGPYKFIFCTALRIFQIYVSVWYQWI